MATTNETNQKGKDMEQKETFEERQYGRLITARNFHYDNIGKWLRFFYLIIGALFVGYYTIHKAAPSNWLFDVIILGLGYIVSLVCYLSAKGHYYWELSWIQMLHNYESKVLEIEPEYKVYSAFANKEGLDHPWLPIAGANVSTSKLALLVNIIVTVLWGAMFLYSIAKPLMPSTPKCCVIVSALVLSVIITYGITGIGAMALKSNLRKVDDLELMQ